MSAGKAFKLVLLGESAVGKSSIVLRYMKDEWKSNIDPTIGAAFSTKTVRVDEGEYIPFEIWDTAGQERYHSLAPMYYRGAQAAIVVYDIRRKDTYEKAKRWIAEVEQSSASDKIVIALVGNKVDLADARKVTTREAQAFAKKANLIAIETSAKTNVNVTELFTLIAKRLKEVFGTVPDARPAASVAQLAEADDAESRSCPC